MEFCGKPDKAQMRKVEITRDLVSCRSIARSRKKRLFGNYGTWFTTQTTLRWLINHKIHEWIYVYDREYIFVSQNARLSRKDSSRSHTCAHFSYTHSDIYVFAGKLMPANEHNARVSNYTFV